MLYCHGLYHYFASTAFVRQYSEAASSTNNLNSGTHCSLSFARSSGSITHCLKYFSKFDFEMDIHNIHGYGRYLRWIWPWLSIWTASQLVGGSTVYVMIAILRY